MKKVGIVQSSYLPWKGYFDLLDRVDEFILLDDVQFTRRDWRNRNRIKTADGTLWLTIPVRAKGRFEQLVRETEVSDPDWPRRHWESIRQWYARAPFFGEYRERFEELFLGCDETLLSEVNRRFLEAIAGVLGCETTISSSADYDLVPGKTERLVGLCRQAGATSYLSGPSARAYLDEALFAEAGIAVEWMDYSNYPEYRQLFPPFEHAVSIIDLLFNEGPEAPRYMRSC